MKHLTVIKNAAHLSQFHALALKYMCTFFFSISRLEQMTFDFQQNVSDSDLDVMLNLFHSEKAWLSITLIF